MNKMSKTLHIHMMQTKLKSMKRSQWPMLVAMETCFPSNGPYPGNRNT